MSAVRVAVFVSGEGTNLQALLDAERSGQMPAAQVTLVVADRPGIGSEARASAAGIAFEVVHPGEGFTDRLADTLSEHGIDMVVLAGYLQYIPVQIVRRYAGRMINIHPSLLPAFGGKGWYGLRVHRGVIERGVKITGATVHLVDEDFDSGPILMQHAVEVRDCDSPESLQERVKTEAEWRILPAATQLMASRIQEEYR